MYTEKRKVPTFPEIRNVPTNKNYKPRLDSNPYIETTTGI
jgi:hypothetical protein